MKVLDFLERRWGRFAIPQLALVIVVGQLAAGLLCLARPEFIEQLLLRPGQVAAGEYWRLVTFLFVPPSGHYLFWAFALYLLYLYGCGLEAQWGAFKFNLYVLIGVVAAIGLSLGTYALGTVLFHAMPEGQAWLASQSTGNYFIITSVFLAFATLYPDFEILLFFILPVKVKWLGLLTAVWLGWMFLFGDLLAKATVAAAVINYGLFFWPELFGRARHGLQHDRQRAEFRAKVAAHESTALHRCGVCGVTEFDDRAAEFRVCSKCGREYCLAHLRDHPETVAVDEAK